jgi:hypothetical protein
MRPWWRSTPGIVGLLVVGALLALLFLPRGDLTRDVSSHGVGRDGYRLGFETLQSLGYDVRRFNHGVELLPADSTLWVLEPGPALMDRGPSGMGGLAEWTAAGNTLLLAFGGRRATLGERLLVDIERDRGELAEEAPDALFPVGTPLEALSALGVFDVSLSGGRIPMDVGFDDPFVVQSSFGELATLQAVRHAPTLEGEGLAAGEVLVEGEHGPLVWRRPIGHGELVLVSDARLLCNYALVDHGNAWLLTHLATLTAGEGPLYFEEFSHGYATVTSMSRILLGPPTVFLTLQLALILLALVTWRAARFGPAIPAATGDRRTRAEHVYALADLHRRGRHGAGAARRLRAHLMARIRDRLGTRLAEHELLAWLAQRLPANEHELAADLTPPHAVEGRSLLEYSRRLERIRRRIEETR